VVFDGIMPSHKALQTSPKISVTVADAARATGFSENYIRLLISRRRLPHIRVGRAIRVLVADLDTFLLSHRSGAQS
jgi:excisionase family DNA binding protein